MNVLRFLRVESVIAREFLLKIDTSLAIATSGLRTNLLFEKPPSENPPFDFPKNDTRHFRRFEVRSPSFYWLKRNSSFLPFSSKRPFFFGSAKGPAHLNWTGSGFALL